MKAILLVFVLLLAACTHATEFVKADPPPENCDPICRTKCEVDPNIKYVPVEGSDRALDDLVEQVVAPLRGEVDRCDTHRVACVQCLDRHKQAGLTR